MSRALGRPAGGPPRPARDALGALFAVITRQLGLRPEGYRRVRGTVEKRLRRRMSVLGLSSFEEYGAYLAVHPGEWSWIEPRCRITISRFGRDRAVFERLVGVHLPGCADAVRGLGRDTLRVWSAGTASGEEAFGVALAWELELQIRYPELRLEVLGTDADPVVLARAERGVYPAGSLRELPDDYRRAFVSRGSEWALPDSVRERVRFVQADLRGAGPGGPFDLISCRNVAFTYFAEGVQRQVAESLVTALAPGGVLVVGVGERVPAGSFGLEPVEPCFYRRGGPSHHGGPA